MEYGDYKSKEMVKYRFLLSLYYVFLSTHTLFIVSMCGEPLTKLLLNLNNA